MSANKSNLPDFNELTAMASKLFKDLQSSVSQIVDEYKKKRESAPEPKPEETSEKKPDNDDKPS